MLFADPAVEAARPTDMDPAEWRLRVELAACYRVFDRKGWAEEIFNHITVRVPGAQRHFLINPFGLHYGEVTAHNLVKIDSAGQVIGRSRHPVNQAGFVIHGAIHAAREDAHCVMHTHHTAGVAVSCKPGGLPIDNFYGAFLSDKLAYHDFEGVTVHEGERELMVQSLGRKTCLILRNHGLLTLGPDIATTYYWLYVLQRACEVHVMASAIPGPNLTVSAEAAAVSVRDGAKTDPQNDLYPKVFAGAVRKAGITLAELVDADGG